tara:strand:- start:307 stop:570 length:264 start_codon:yes stop_codon:yes gene_type:complete
MNKEENLNKEIKSLKNDIQLLKELIHTILLNLEKEPHLIKISHKTIKNFLEEINHSELKQKNFSKKLKKNSKRNLDEETYDWIEDTI